MAAKSDIPSRIYRVGELRVLRDGSRMLQGDDVFDLPDRTHLYCADIKNGSFPESIDLTHYAWGTVERYRGKVSPIPLCTYRDKEDAYRWKEVALRDFDNSNIQVVELFYRGIGV